MKWLQGEYGETDFRLDNFFFNIFISPVCVPCNFLIFFYTSCVYFTIIPLSISTKYQLINLLYVPFSRICLLILSVWLFSLFIYLTIRFWRSVSVAGSCFLHWTQKILTINRKLARYFPFYFFLFIYVYFFFLVSLPSSFINIGNRKILAPGKMLTRIKLWPEIFRD